MKKHRLLLESAVALLMAMSISAPASTTYAATEAALTSSTAVPTDQDSTAYTAEEQATINKLQAEYAELVGSNNSISDIYATIPSTTAPFATGALNSTAIQKVVAWVNYYRALSGLPAINSNSDSNDLAQIASAVMAYAQSDPYTNQHGLKGTTQPQDISDLYWNRAILGTSQSDLYFGFPSTLGSLVKELIIDNTNIDGFDTGHRAWLLSPYLSKIGVGMAKSDTGRTYASLLVANTPDQYNTPSQNVVTYPSQGVFPVEELQDDKALPWSVAFAKDADLVTDNTTITVTNLTNGTTGTVLPSYSGSQAYSKTVISFLPPTTLTINDHSEYQVTINGLNSSSMPSYTYTFKTFSENSSINSN